MTDADVRNSGRKALAAKYPMIRVSRAFEKSETQGFMKVLVDANTKQILGAMILGVEGGEIMSMLEIAMLGKLPYTVLRDAVFAQQAQVGRAFLVDFDIFAERGLLDPALTGEDDEEDLFGEGADRRDADHALARVQAEQSARHLGARGSRRLGQLGNPYGCHSARGQLTQQVVSRVRTLHVQQALVAAHRPATELWKYDDFLCPGGRPADNETAVRVDGIHYTYIGADYVWRWIFGQLEAR